MLLCAKVKEQGLCQAWLHLAQMMSSGPGLTPSFYLLHLPPHSVTPVLTYIMPLLSSCNPVAIWGKCSGKARKSLVEEQSLC